LTWCRHDEDYGPAMSRFLVFLAVAVGIVGGVHLYFWVRLIRDTAIAFPYRPWATAAVVALAALVPLPILVGRRLPPEWSRLVVWPSAIWMGTMLLLLVALLGLDLARLLAALGAKLGGAAPIDPARRTFLARLLGGTAGLGAGLVAAVAVKQALRELIVTEVSVQLPRLPAASHGTTIVQLTDLHVGPTIGRAFVEDVVRRTNALAPDIVAITGDLVDGSVDSLWNAVAPLAGLRARHGVYFVTGNHEYFSGADAWVAALSKLGIRVLANERVAIGEGQGPQDGFDLAGVHDHGAARIGEGHRSDVAAALAGRDPRREVVLLAHQPKSVYAAAELGVGLQLSGHTHGGQIWPFSFFVRLTQPFLTGLHRHRDTQVYVSPGTGYWGPPMRLGTRAEITKITLLSSSSRA
jgi:predicted MPP superfamily phosphohydrolase